MSLRNATLPNTKTWLNIKCDGMECDFHEVNDLNVNRIDSLNTPVPIGVGDDIKMDSGFSFNSEKYKFQVLASDPVTPPPAGESALYYNSVSNMLRMWNAGTSMWVDVDTAGAGITSLTNVGTGAGQIFRDIAPAGNTNLKTIKAGTSIGVTDNADDVTLDLNSAITVDSINERTPANGIDIGTITVSDGVPTLTNTSATDGFIFDNTSANPGSGNMSFQNNIANDYLFVGGNDVDFQISGDLKTNRIQPTSGSSMRVNDLNIVDNDIANNGASDMEIDGVAFDLILKAFSAVKIKDIDITDSPSAITNTGANDLTIEHSSGNDIILEAESGTSGDVIVKPNLKITDAGSGGTATLTTNSSNYLLNGGNIVVESASNLGAGANVFKQKTDADLELRSLVPGVGVVLTENTNDVTITANNEIWLGPERLTQGKDKPGVKIDNNFFLSLEFDNGKDVIWQQQLPDVYSDGNDITVTAYWYTSDIVGNNTWDLFSRKNTLGSVRDNTIGDTDQVISAVPGVANTIASTVFTVDGSGYVAGDIINFQFELNTKSGAKPNVMGIKLSY
jgi:hypothetical protein